VLIASSSAPGGNGADGCARDGSVAAINRSNGKIEVTVADGSDCPSRVTVLPEQLEPVNVRRADATLQEPLPKRWWERGAEAGARIPAEDRAQIPRDAAENLDLYPYGWEKRNG
jgi:hypothetical protein